MTKVYKYIGNGDFVPGIPARDITEGEAIERGFLELVEASTIFELVDDQEPLNEDGEEK